jgi:hypothetical protein
MTRIESEIKRAPAADVTEGVRAIVEIEKSDSGFRISLRTQVGSARGERTIEGASCRELSEAAILIVALSVAEAGDERARAGRKDPGVDASSSPTRAAQPGEQASKATQLGFLMRPEIVSDFGLLGSQPMLGPGLGKIMVAVGIVNIPIFARLLRSSILAQKQNDLVLAAKAGRVRGRSILSSHILPNSISPVIVAATLAMATAIIDVAGLGFLGLGPQDPATPEWGTMLTDANNYLSIAPFLAIIPGLAIVLSVLGFNLIGDGLRETLDPKLRGR